MMERKSQRNPARGALVSVLAMMGAIGASMLIWSGGASAQVDPYTSASPSTSPTVIPSPTPTKPEVLPTIISQTTTTSDNVLGTGLTRPPGPGPAPEDNVLGAPPEPNRLPLTGADLALFVATGSAAIGTGAFLVRRGRRSRHQGDA